MVYEAIFNWVSVFTFLNYLKIHLESLQAVEHLYNPLHYELLKYHNLGVKH